MLLASLTMKLVKTVGKRGELGPTLCHKREFCKNLDPVLVKVVHL